MKKLQKTILSVSMPAYWARPSACATAPTMRAGAMKRSKETFGEIKDYLFTFKKLRIRR